MLFNEMIKSAVRESIKRGNDITEKIIRNSIKERHKRSKIAQARNAKPGTKRWENLLRDSRQVRRRRRGSKS